jgi:iron complex outermembrane recepter protein
MIHHKTIICIFFYIFLGLFFFLSSFHLSAQEDSLSIQDMLKLSVTDMYELSKEDLLNVEVSIASKKSESLFETPFSVAVITKEEIRKAGATSLMEAFRLMPGLIVMEQSNGNYDIHVRGGNNVQRNSIFSIGGNTTTLVMIDNRPAYNYYLGGTFWETIPIDLNDIERIELIKGASSAMYGPNALSGIINIITKTPRLKGTYLTANFQQGTQNSYINNLSLGYNLDQKFKFILSGNWQQRDRTQKTYYNYPRNEYVVLDSLTQPIPLGEAYPHTELSMQKWGMNAFMIYEPKPKVGVRLSAGLQDSEAQKAYSENFATPLTEARSRSKYVDMNAQYHQFNTQVSYQNGTQEEGLGTLGQKWDFHTWDVVAEYDLNFIKGLNIKPGVNYRQAIYDDTPYVDVANKTGQFNGKREITTFAAYLRGDYLLMHDKLRLIAAIRGDVFNLPKEPYLSYQFAINYKVNPKHLIRALYARANRSANIIFTYADRFLTNFNGAGVALEVAGNKDLKLLTSDLFELGYRAKLSDQLQIDVEAFYSQAKNYADFLYATTYTGNVGGVPTQIQPFKTLNIPLKTQQTGITLSVNYVSNQIQIRPYITYQQTTLTNSSTFTNTPDAIYAPTADPATDNIFSNVGKSETHTGVPSWFGGAFLNYQTGKLNINLNPYFFSSYTYFSFQNANYPDGRAMEEIKAKLILNARIGLRPVSGLEIFISGKNLLNQNTNEFFRTDSIGLNVFAGIHFDF